MNTLSRAFEDSGGRVGYIASAIVPVCLGARSCTMGAWIALYCTVLYCTALYCTALLYPPTPLNCVTFI